VKERLARVLTSLTAKYVAVFVLLVAVPAIGISAYLLNSSYNDNKRALIQLEQDKAKALVAAAQQRLDTTVGQLQSYFLERDTPTGSRPLSAHELALEMQTVEFNNGDTYADESFVVDGHGHARFSDGDFLASPVMGKRARSRAHQVLQAIVASVRHKGVYYGPTSPGTPTGTGAAGDSGLWVATATDRAQGIAGVHVGLLFLQDLLENAQIGPKGYAWAVSADGKVISYPSWVADISGIGAPNPGRLPQAHKAVTSRTQTGWTIGRVWTGRSS
jgi:hypothetical protein